MKTDERQFMRTHTRNKTTPPGRCFALAMTVALLMAGCSTHSPKHVFNEQEATMQTIYQQQMTNAHRRPIDQVREDVPQTHTALESLPLATQANHFVKLPNPDVTMTVYPHFQGETHLPVPGFTTPFALYNGHPIAHPGEV